MQDHTRCVVQHRLANVCLPSCWRDCENQENLEAETTLLDDRKVQQNFVGNAQDTVLSLLFFVWVTVIPIPSLLDIEIAASNVWWLVWAFSILSARP